MLVKDCWVGQWLVPTSRHYIPYICKVVSLNRVSHYIDVFWDSDKSEDFIREEDLNLDYSTLKDGM